MIKVQNIYYMLAYAFQSLNSRENKKYGSEEFNYAKDLFAAILSNGVSKQLKQGLGREYIIQQEILSAPRGKICLADTFKLQASQKKLTSCQVDDYIENTYMNQILKSTIMMLLHSNDVRPVNKSKIKRIIPFFSAVDVIDCRDIHWDRLQYNSNNRSYKMLMNICYLVIEGMLMSEEKGKYKLSEYIDDQRMSTLYEKFILSYYKKHYPDLKVTQSHIDWNTDDSIITLLPQMKSDIMIEYCGKTFIIDAKYYTSSMQTGQYGKETIHSHNLYQIFTYVKNKDTEANGNVTGMLLYANTEGSNPDMDYHLSGNKISVKTLDLNCNFDKVTSQLDNIVNTWMRENDLSCQRVS